jgi:hypothetical protein
MMMFIILVLECSFSEKRIVFRKIISWGCMQVQSDGIRTKGGQAWSVEIHYLLLPPVVPMLYQKPVLVFRSGQASTDSQRRLSFITSSASLALFFSGEIYYYSHTGLFCYFLTFSAPRVMRKYYLLLAFFSCYCCIFIMFR